jgi:Flp pilus assembly protein TadD
MTDIHKPSGLLRPATPKNVTMRNTRLARRFLTCAGAAALVLTLGACQGRGLGDITGSLGGTAAPTTEAEWRRDSEKWAARYQSSPNDRNNALYYARALRALDQNAQATAILQTAILVHKNDMELLGAYGKALADAGQLQQAEDVLSRAHTPERPDWRILSAHGSVADQLGDHARAQGMYQTALKIMPGEPGILSNLGLSYALSKRLAEAEQVLRTAAAHPRADYRVRQNLVMVLGLQGRFTEAEQVARTDNTPEQAAQIVGYLKNQVSQPNSWKMLKGNGTADARRSPANRPG